MKFVVQRVKCLPVMWETQVQSLGREDPLEKEIATHSGTLAWKIPWMEKPGRLQSTGLQRVGHNWVTSPSFLLSFKFTGPSWAGMLQWHDTDAPVSWTQAHSVLLLCLVCRWGWGSVAWTSPRSSVDIQTLRPYPDLLTQMWILTRSPGDSLYS